MPNLTINVGGRAFDVACQEGEETFLQKAAQLLDSEAAVLVDQIGRMPEGRMLLMAGLMLADKTAGTEEQVQKTLNEMRSMRAELEALKSERDALRAERDEVDLRSLATLAGRAEALADRLDATN